MTAQASRGNYDGDNVNTNTSRRQLPARWKGLNAAWENVDKHWVIPGTLMCNNGALCYMLSWFERLWFIYQMLLQWASH